MQVIASGAAALLVSVTLSAASPSDIADAVMRGDKALTQMLLDQRVDVNAPQSDGATALHWAVYENDSGTVARLVRAGANVNAANRDGASVLSLACINGNAAIIETLLNAGANANSRMANGETPLMMAARTGDLESIKVLLRHGAEVNSREPIRGTTALMWAASESHADAVQLLIEHGADVSARSNAAPKGRSAYLAPTAKERARQEGPARAGGQRGQRGPRPVAASTSASAGIDQDLAERIEFLNRGDQDGGGLTALVFAARQGSIDSVRVMLDAGADPNQVTNYGWSPLLTATQNRFYKLGSLLLDRGADPNIANNGGWTPLYIATDNRNIENGDYPTRKPDMDHLNFIRLLLDHGANVNARMKDSTETRTIFTHQWLYEDGATAFLRASQSGDVVLMRLLLEHGVDPKIATANGTTPLMVASGIGWVEGVTNEMGRKENLEAVKLLLDLGADVNAVDGDGRTALHGAAHKGRNEVVQLLVEHGARLDAHDGGSRDTIAGDLVGHTWQPIDYADGLVRVGVQSAVPHPETAALLRKLMVEKGLAVPPANRTLQSICITEVCK
jgi:ankyrin repeat protein